MRVIGIRTPLLQATLALLLATASVTAVFGQLDTDAPQFRELKDKYSEIVAKYPAVRKSQMEKMLAAYKRSAEERYQQEKRNSNLEGMGLAKEAMKLIEGFQTQLESEGDFEIPEDVRRGLEDFLRQIRESKRTLEEKFKMRKRRLRNSTYANFAHQARLEMPNADPEVLRSLFERWIADAGAAERAAPPPKPEPSPSKEGGPVSDLGLNLSSENFEKLKMLFEKARSRIGSRRRDALRGFLESSRADARKRYEAEKKRRNIKNMAVARETVSILEEASASLQQNGSFELPDEDDVRRELRDRIRRLREGKQEIFAEFEQQQERLLRETFDRFEAFAIRQVPEVDREKLRELFDAWLEGREIARRRSEPGATPPPDRQGLEAPATNVKTSEYFASRGESTEWFTVGRWQAETRGAEIFEIPVYDGEDVSGSKYNVQFGGASEWSYQHVAGLERNRYYALRLKVLEGMKPVTVAEWPNARNDWMLIVRTGLAGGEYGFEIQAGRSGTEQAGAVAIPVNTQPQGAEVFVDGERYYAPGENSVTPLTIKMAPGSHTVLLKLEDHLGKKIENFQARQGARLQYRFTHESEVDGQTVRVRADRDWMRSSVEVAKGDKVWLVPSGRWACGKRGESVGPAGYPRADYPHYYRGAELRQERDAHYGALLMEIDRRDQAAAPENIVPVPGRTSLQADDWGRLWFDINEKEGRKYRQDNRGDLEVKVVVFPDGKIPLAD